MSDDADSVQMLQRSTQVGEYYRMMPPHTWDPKKLLPQAHMDIVIYDEEADKHVHITFEQALYATCVEDAGWAAVANGAPMSIATRLFGVTGAQAQADFRAKLLAHFGIPAANAPGNEDLWGDQFGRSLNPPVRGAVEAGRAVNTLYNADPPTKQMLVNCVKAGVKLPICITIVRPFIEHLCMSAIMTVSGRDTGATLFGPADSAPARHPPPATRRCRAHQFHRPSRLLAPVQISANTTVKTIEGYACTLARPNSPFRSAPPADKLRAVLPFAGTTRATQSRSSPSRKSALAVALP